MKYQPDYPGRFRDIAHAREWCSTFFAWYNDVHHHDGLALFTPAQVFHGHVERVATLRQEALDAAYRRNPERFVNGPPAAARPPSRVLLNPLDAAPPTVQKVIAATVSELDVLWPSAAVSGVPIINLPGAPVSQVDVVNAS